MRRFMCFVLIGCVTILGVLTSLILVARLNAAPGKLQALGFGLCTGKPCFRGVAPGAEWIKIPGLFVEAAVTGKQITIPIDSVDVTQVSLFASDDRKVVETIAINRDYSTLASIPVGEVIAQFGAPCRLLLEYHDGVPSQMILMYRSLMVFADIEEVNPSGEPIALRLNTSSSVEEFWVTADQSYGSCEDKDGELSGAWRGFTSAQVYQTRNRQVPQVPP